MQAGEQNSCQGTRVSIPLPAAPLLCCSPALAAQPRVPVDRLGDAFGQWDCGLESQALMCAGDVEVSLGLAVGLAGVPLERAGVADGLGDRAGQVRDGGSRRRYRG